MTYEQQAPGALNICEVKIKMCNTDNHIVFMIYQLKKNLRRKINAVINEEDVTFEQFEVLNSLTFNDGMSQKNLSKRLDKDPATLTKMLHLLEKKGYVTRSLSMKDRRVSNVFITLKGLEKVQHITDLIENLDEVICDSLSSSSQLVLKDMICKMNKSLAAVSA